MKAHHWFGLFVVLFIGYMAGIFFPALGTKLRSTIGM